MEQPGARYKTLRDEIAIAAMVAIISRGDLDTEMDVMPYCLDAYTIADSMLEASNSTASQTPTTNSSQ